MRTFRRAAVLGGLGVLLAAPASAQDPDAPTSYTAIDSLTLDNAQKTVAQLGFKCAPDKEPPTPQDVAFNCVASGKGQGYTVDMVGDKEGHLFVLTAHSRRPAGAKYDLDAALKMLIAIARVHGEADAADVRLWIHKQIGDPLASMTNPAKEMYNPRTGLPWKSEPLTIAGVTFTAVGLPDSPGFDMALKGY